MAEELAQKRCVPCEGGTPPMSADEAERLRGQLHGWQTVEGTQLRKAYTFPDFVEAVAFVNAITPVAEAEGHHPDLLVRWGEVRVDLSTHAVRGLTENDFILAAKIDQLPRPSRPSP